VRIFRQVVVAARHREAALQQIWNLGGGFFQPFGHEQAEQVRGVEVGGVDRVDVGAQARTQHAREIGAGLDCVDRIQFGFQWRQARLVDGGGVHVRGVIICDLARVAAGSRIAGARVPDEIGGVLLGDLEYIEE